MIERLRVHSKYVREDRCASQIPQGSLKGLSNKILMANNIFKITGIKIG